jgi:spermidine synthase
MIGLGGGSGVRMLRRAVPGMKLDVVELDPVVIEAATAQFGIEPGEKLNLIEGDGRKYLEGTRSKWDTIILDAFDEKFIPFALATIEFQRLVRGHLSAHGTMVSNLWRTNEPLFRAMVKTMREVFPSLHIFDTKEGNTIVVGTMDRVKVTREELVERAIERGRGGHFGFDFREVPEGYTPVSGVDLGKAPVFRDGHPEQMSGFGEP